MAEECNDPVRDFPKMMLTGLGITGTIYVLVSITAVALVPVGDLTDPEKGQALTQVVAAGAPDLPFDKIFPFIGMFAVANSALINMLMASRLLYGMANQDVLPRIFGEVHPRRRTPWVAIIFTTLIAFGLIIYVVRATASDDGATNVALLGGTTALLLLCVFTVVNVALLILRRQPVDHDHFRTPTFLPVVGAVTCAFLAGPWARTDEQLDQYKIAGGLLVARHRALGGDVDDQPRRPREEDRLPRHRAPGGRDGSSTRARVVARWWSGVPRRIIADMRARWVLAGAAALFYLVALPIDIAIERASGWYGGSLQEAATFEPGLLATFLVGWLLVLRRAGGVIGWLLVGNWLLLSLSAMVSTYAGYAYGTGKRPARRQGGGDLGHPRLADVVRPHRGRRLRGPRRQAAVAAVARGRLVRRRCIHGHHSRRSDLVGGARPPVPGGRALGPAGRAGRHDDAGRGPARHDRDPAPGRRLAGRALPPCGPHREAPAEVDRTGRTA